MFHNRGNSTPPYGYFLSWSQLALTLKHGINPRSPHPLSQRTHYQMLHLYPETRSEQTPFDSSSPQSFEQDYKKQLKWICLSGMHTMILWAQWAVGWIELPRELSLGSYIGLGPSKANPKYFWIWLRLTFVARPSNISQFVWICKRFLKKNHKNSFCFKLSEIFTLNEL
jgi:hypothetical protein